MRTPRRSRTDRPGKHAHHLNHYQTGDHHAATAAVTSQRWIEAKDTWPAITEITQEAQTQFPVDALPPGMRAAVEEVACTRMVDPAIPAAALLAAAAGAVGGRLGVHINSSWYTRCNLYIAVVAETGDGKSPGIRESLIFSAWAGRGSGVGAGVCETMGHAC